MLYLWGKSNCLNHLIYKYSLWHSVLDCDVLLLWFCLITFFSTVHCSFVWIKKEYLSKIVELSGIEIWLLTSSMADDLRWLSIVKFYVLMILSYFDTRVHIIRNKPVLVFKYYHCTCQIFKTMQFLYLRNLHFFSLLLIWTYTQECHLWSLCLVHTKWSAWLIIVSHIWNKVTTKIWKPYISRVIFEWEIFVCHCKPRSFNSTKLPHL